MEPQRPSDKTKKTGEYMNDFTSSYKEISGFSRKDRSREAGAAPVRKTFHSGAV
jgi:hypothetical protein